ncbi:MAG: ATP-binding protein [Chloroflexaceae bacterium]|nr:ATP-binding protein [Chloroflexaceae bacterium]
MIQEPLAPPPLIANAARVLIADDDATMSSFCARALSAGGYTVVTVGEAEAAIAALQTQGPFDLLLADIKMPGRSGLELAQIAREIDPAIAVVIMTGHSTVDTLHASVRRGVTDYLTKPFEVDELRLVVEQALHKRGLLQQSLRLRALEELLRSSEAINAILDRNELAREIIAHARAHAPGEAGFLFVAGADHLPPQVFAEPSGATIQPAGREAVAQSLRIGRPLPVASAEPLALLEATPLTHGLAVPLRARGETIGALLLCGAHDEFNAPGASEFLALLANQAGNALRNAQLYSQLDAAYNSLRELDRLKSEFIAIASHELRSPLSIVLGYAKMVHDRSSGDLREYAQRLLTGAERIKAIVNDLLHLRDFDRKQTTLTLERSALDALARQAVERLVPAAQQKGQDLSVAQPDQPVILEVDREKVLLVIGNLIDNAIKFTPPGGRIQVEVVRWPHEHLIAEIARAVANPTMRRLTEGAPATWALVRVKDTGIGIPREHQGRIFERFYQVASSLTREQGGAGLGLAIVCDLVALQGGVVWVKSEEGRGSIFNFALPLP